MRHKRGLFFEKGLFLFLGIKGGLFIIFIVLEGAFLSGMKSFVDESSVVRKVWGKADTILFIFAGASAEFALNKAVDWLYFTGKLPADPLQRLFSTVSYARQIVFSEHEAALQAIDKISAIHRAVEQQRSRQIPDWAYRDVLFMLIDYSIRSFELLERKLTQGEKEEVFNVFYRVGLRMEIKDLPGDYEEWLSERERHLRENLRYSDFTRDLYRQYGKHLGRLRYYLLKQVQMWLVPERVKILLGLNHPAWLKPALQVYKFSRHFGLNNLLKSLLLPPDYKKQIADLDIISAG